MIKKSHFSHNNLFFATLFCVLFSFSSCSKEKRSDKKGELMQQFVIDISNYARGINANFIIIPQNGTELAFNYLFQNDGINDVYMSAIDGFGIESLFYNGNSIIDSERLTMLQQLVISKKVMVSDYVSSDANITDAIQKNQAEGFISFPRASTNYDYLQIPNTVINENANNIITLNDAQNYLYMINTANFTTKKTMLNAISVTNFDVVLIDLFFGDIELTKMDINQLKTKANGGKRLVISYMNIGSAENFRYYWKSKWKLHRPNWLKKKYTGYADEIWVKFWKNPWKEIIFGNNNSYTKKILEAGFDGVYLDNVEAYYFLYFE